MPISFACPCGKQLAAKEEHAGKLIKCPICSRERIVPNVESLDKPPKEPLDFSKSSGPRRRKRERPKEQRRVLWPWFVGAGVGAVALLALVAIPLAFFLGRNSSTPDTGRSAKEATPVASARPAKMAEETRPNLIAPVPPAEVKKPAPPSPLPTPAPAAKPDDKPLPGQEKRPNDPFAVRLLRFGTARIDAGDFQGQTLAGAVIELEASGGDGKVHLEAPSITATDKDGKPVSAAVLFIAGGRDGLGPTATILAGTTGEAFDVSIGKSRFAPGPFPAAMRGLRNVKTGDVPATAQVNPRLNDFVIRATDLMMVMPLNLAKGGGVEYVLLPNRKVQLGVVFMADADKLTGIKLLGHSVRIELAKLDDAPLPAAMGRNGPNFPPMPVVPGVRPPPAGADDNAANEATGLWAVKAEGGEPWLVVEDFNCHAVAVSKDLKQRAVFRMPSADDPAPVKPGKPGKPVRGGGDEVAVGPMDKPLRTIWTSDAAPQGPYVGTSLHWSPGGQRLLVATFNNLIVVDLKGKASVIGRATAARQPGVVGFGTLEPASARWAGRSDTEVAVISLAPQHLLTLLNVATGQQRDLCPLPPGFGRTTFRVSDDQKTVAVFVSAPSGLDPQGTAGVWVWRRGQKAPVRLVTGNPETGALSPDGKYIAATLENTGKRRCVVYQVAEKKELWTADCAGFGYAFDSAGKRLAITTGQQNQLLVTPVAKFEPNELVKGKVLPITELAWSTDGKEIVFRRTSKQRPINFRP